MEGADGTSINTSHLTGTWRAKMKGKERRGKEKGGLRNQERNTVVTEN